jgi:hypothetical protein
MTTSLRAAAVLAVLAGSGCLVQRPLPAATPTWTPPPGAVPVALLSDGAQQRWDVYANDQFLCSTPCKRRLDPARPLLLHPHGQEWGLDLHVPDLFPAAREGPVALHVTRANEALEAAGNVPTIAGAIPAILCGILTPLVCAYTLSQDPRYCYAFAAITAAGVGLTGIGVGLNAAGHPRPVVIPAREYLAGGGAY